MVGGMESATETGDQIRKEWKIRYYGKALKWFLIVFYNWADIWTSD